MKCPDCNREIERQYEGFEGLGIVIANLMFFGLPIAIILDKLPINMEDGYNANYSMVIVAILMIIYGIYAFLFTLNKCKGKYLITNLLKKSAI